MARNEGIVRASRDGLLAALFVLAAAGLTSLVVYVQSARSLRDEVRDHIMQLASAASVVVDGDLHGTFVSPEQEGSPAYQQAIRPLAAFLEVNPSTRFVYTFIAIDGQVHLILDPTSSGDADLDGVEDKAHVMDRYDDTSEAMREVLAEGHPVSESEPGADQWGTFMSAYAPLWDSAGALVGAIGVDVSVQVYEARLATMQRALRSGMAVALGLSLLIGLVVWRLRLGAIRAQATIARMLEDVRSARDAAQSAARANADFLASMSHEIRTPMNAILGLSELLLDKGPPAEFRADLEVIYRSGDTLLAILNDVLDLSKLEAGMFPVQRIPVDLTSLVSDAARLFGPVARERGIEMRVSVDPSLPQCFVGDPVRLRQVLSNLLGNALKFTQQGSVSLSVERSPESARTLVFSVADTGIGIPPDQLERVFEKFAQLEGGQRVRAKGTGLGLSIARSLVELMGGSIAVTSTVAEGSTFTFTVPLVPTDEAIPDQERAHASVLGTVAEGSRRDPLGDIRDEEEQVATGRIVASRILLADDDPVNRMIAVRLLEGWGCCVETAESGTEVVRKCLEGAFDLVLMDLHLPEMNGDTATRVIREQERGRRTPIVAWTASAMAQDQLRCRQAGMDDFLSKPIQRAKLHRVIRRYSAGEPDTSRDAA